MRWLKRSSYTENAGRNLLNASEATLRKDGSVEFADVEEGSLDSNHLEAPRRRQLQADQTLRQWRPGRRRRPLPSRTQVRRRRPRVLPRSGSHRRAYSPSTADDAVRCGDRRYVQRSAKLATAASRDEPRFQLDSRRMLLRLSTTSRQEELWCRPTGTHASSTRSTLHSLPPAPTDRLTARDVSVLDMLERRGAE
jgi:hypothetical protein